RRIIGNPRARDDDAAAPQVERELHHLADVFEPRLQVLGDIQPAAERHVERREVLIERPQQVAELPPASLAERVGAQVADGIDLDARGPHLRGLGDGLAERQPGGLDDNPDAKRFHGKRRMNHKGTKGTKKTKTFYVGHFASVFSFVSSVPLWFISPRNSEKGFTRRRKVSAARCTVSQRGLQRRM